MWTAPCLHCLLDSRFSRRSRLVTPAKRATASASRGLWRVRFPGVSGHCGGRRPASRYRDPADPTGGVSGKGGVVRVNLFGRRVNIKQHLIGNKINRAKACKDKDTKKTK